MLLQLEIKDFAIIEHTIINFDKGLNVLTGETGAGKSIILDSLMASLGGRVNKEMVRKDAENSYIKAVFKKNEIIKEILNQNSINNEDDFLVFERQINKNGRSVTKINGSIQTVQSLKELSNYLIEICGQKDQQELTKEGFALELIDQFMNEEFSLKIEEYKERYKHLKNLKNKLVSLNDDEKEKERLIDLYKFQKKEIEDAKLKENEEENLENEIKALSSFEKISELLSYSINKISSIDEIYESFKKAQEISKYDNKFEELSERIEKSYYELEDIKNEMEDYSDSMEYDSTKLDELIKRSMVYKNIKRKYGDNLKEINIFLEKITEKLNEIENKDEVIEKLQKEIKEVEEENKKMAILISKKRKEISKFVSSKINEQIQQLCMPESEIKFEFIEEENLNLYGMDKINLMFMANKGDDYKFLNKIASGGELSRILLAITLGTKINKEKVYFFDEIDEGVGGETGRVIGKKLYQLGKQVQVMVISHLPQVAAKGDNHFLIKKESNGSKTLSKVINMSLEQRIEEIARMIYGDEADEITKKQAIEMLKKE